MKLLQNQDVTPKRNRPVAEFLIFLYVIENVIGSSGRLLTVGSLSLREILFVCCFVATLPALFANLKSMVRNHQVLVTCCFGLWWIACAVIGFLQGNRTGFVRADITPFLSLALLPGFLCVINTKKQVDRMMRTVYWAAFALSIVTIAIHMILALCPDQWINAINNFLNGKSLGGLARLNTGCHRVYMRSQIFIQVALTYGIWLIFQQTGHKKIGLMICEGIMLFALLICYTRGFWIGFFVAAVIVLVLERKVWKKLIAIACAAGVVTAGLLVASACAYGSFTATAEIINRFSPNLMVGTGSIIGSGNTTEFPTEPSTTEPPTQTDISDEKATILRRDTLLAIYKKIGDHPIMGNGLGANLDGLRDDGKVEYMYMDVLLKSGVIGLVLFLATFFYPIAMLLWQVWRRRRKAEPICMPSMQTSVAIAAYISVAVTSWVNPYLSNPMGITLLMFTSVVVSLNGKSENIEKGEEL